MSQVTSSRRQLVGGSIVAALSGVAAAVVLPGHSEASENPDAELIRLCAECDALQAKIDKQYATPWENLSLNGMSAREKAISVAIEPWEEQQEPLLQRICTFRATTPQGHAARARTLLGWDKAPCWVDDDCWNSQLLGAIVRDLVGSVAA